MELKAYNKRLGHITEVSSIDFTNNEIKLMQPNSSPKFYYKEKLSNVELMEYSGIELDGNKIFEGDKVKDANGNMHVVIKKPGGFYPFVKPVEIKFKRA